VNSVSPGPIDGTEGMDRLAPTPEAKAAAARARSDNAGLPQAAEPASHAPAAVGGQDDARDIAGVVGG